MRNKVNKILFAAFGLTLFFLFTTDMKTNTGVIGRDYSFSWREASDSSLRQDQNLYVKERYHLQWTLDGHCFDANGKAARVTSHMTSSLIHNFTTYLNKEVRRRIVDIAKADFIDVTSPAILWRNDRLVLVARLCFEGIAKGRRAYKRNWLYTQQYDKYMNPIWSGSYIGIPLTGVHEVFGEYGPQETRLFAVKGKLFVLFNAWIQFNASNFIMHMVMWDYDSSKPVLPRVKNMTLFTKTQLQKNWVPLIQNDEIYLVQNLDPLRIMHCRLDGTCDYAHDEVNATNYVLKQRKMFLRGGTPFELYQWPYFISIAHSLTMRGNKRFYAAHIVVLCVKLYRIVYLSNIIKIHDDIYSSFAQLYNYEFFFFPVGLILENKDTLAIAGHVNDHGTILVRLTGVQLLMNKVITQDLQKATQKGPPVPSVQDYLADMLRNQYQL